MKPNENSSSQGGTPLLQQRPIVMDQKSNTGDDLKSREASAQIFRNKIDTLFADKNTIDENRIELSDTNPYERTHSEFAGQPTTNDWKEYHTAWQDYYQKYYEGYYNHHLQKAKENLNSTPDQDEAEFKLKQKLLSKIKESANKVRKSRHFIPIMSGLLAIVIFLFIQYNSLLIGSVMAYISPGYISPQNIIVDPTNTVTVSPEPRIIIPKINVDVPVSYDIGNDYDSQMAAMAKGLAHFAIPGASSHPGEIGNTVIAGHSSNDLFDSGNYKFIFAQLEKLNIGDTIYANYNSVRYTYTVTKKQVVAPDDVNSLVYPTDKPILTLITCVPVGTANSRLLVTAEQISPNPSDIKTNTDSKVENTNSIPGKQPSIIERLFGIN